MPFKMLARTSSFVKGAFNVKGALTVDGTTTLTGALTATAGRTPNVEARTATANGLTTGLISLGTDHVTVTSANSAHIVTLPDIPVGKEICVDVGANGCRIATHAPATVGINSGVGASANSTIAANSTCILKRVSATNYKGVFWDPDSDVAKIPAAA